MIREATAADAAIIAEIYNHYVLTTDVTFETDALTTDDMLRRMEGVMAEGPFIVAVDSDGNVEGFAYAHRWRERRAYSHTYETTVYVDHRRQGHGTGRELLRELIARCRMLDIRALIACITETNKPSIQLHEEEGFLRVSHFKEVGRKFGQWLDVVDYELMLRF